MATERQLRSDLTYRLTAWAGHMWIYALLLGGALIFSWPFLWMATTSVKVDRELFGDTMRLWPQRPIPVARSPYIDTRYFRDLTGPRLDELLPALVAHLDRMDYPWPADVNRVAAIEQAARGVYKKLLHTMPPAAFDWPADELRQEAIRRVDAAMLDEMIRQTRRRLSLGALRVRSYDLQEEEFARTWLVTGPARLVPVAEGREHFADLHYDFTLGDTLELMQTFTTGFPINRLHRIELSLRSDDSWHPLTVFVEKEGKRYRAVKPYYLGDFNWAVVTWQEPGPDDKTNKIRTWTLLAADGPSDVIDPHQLRITIRVQKNSALGAWWAKISRNYRLALDHIPFGRYVATSVFLVILNLVGTLFSCSLVAYSFARLQWPGRGFCFALMVATMMIPGQVTMIPHFLIMRSLGWYNTLYPLWVGSLFAGAFNVFLLRQFLKGIPRDLEDAAKIDGCGFWRVYWYVMLPLVKPTLAAIAIFTFMGVWNDFMGPLIFRNCSGSPTMGLPVTEE